VIGDGKMKEFKMMMRGFLALITYLLMTFLIALPFVIFDIDVDSMSNTIKYVYLALYELLMLVIIIYMFQSHLKEKLQDLRKNHQHYFTEYFKYWLLAFGLMALANMVIQMFGGDVASNQNAIDEIFNDNPLYVFYSAVIIAPLLEELVFRLGFRYIFKTDYLFIIFSGLTFGFIHILAAENIVNELIFLIPYSIPGFVFAYVLTKSKNIFVPIGLHFMHNGFLMAIQFLVLLLS
jgi:uncharacterized protein